MRCRHSNLCVTKHFIGFLLCSNLARASVLANFLANLTTFMPWIQSQHAKHEQRTAIYTV